MNQNTIQLTLTVKDDGSVVVQQFGKNIEGTLGKAASSVDIMSSAWVKAGVAIAAVEYAVAKVQQAMEFLSEGAKAAQAEVSFHALAATANESADQIIAAMKRASAGTIDMFQMEQKATKAMMLDFSGDQITQMMEMARQGARMTGEDVGQVFDKIVDAISTNMPRALRQYGLVTKEQMAIVNQAMAEGNTDINLLSMATSNYAVQQARLGPLLDDSAEKLQANKAKWQEMKESISQFLYNAGVPVLEWLAKVSPLAQAMSMISSIHSPESTPAGTQSSEDVAAAEKMAQSYNNQLKASLGLVAQKKIDLEMMKGLDKDYLKSQEDNIKYIAELMKAAGGDEYKITSDSLQKIAALNTDYYARTAAEIKLEADARTKAEKDKVSDVQFTADKMKVLDAEMANRTTTLTQQQTMLSIQTAQNDIKILTARLGDYQKYYDSLKAMMDKNTADEKKHLDDLKVIQKQYTNTQKTTSDLIAKITGADKSLTTQQQYESGRSSLNQQFMDITNQQIGQDQIKALEAYKQAVAALQAQFTQGTGGTSASKVAEDAISDINRAAQMQQSTLSALADQMQKQIQTDETWGLTLQGEAKNSANSILDIQNTITDLTAKMEAMKKEIEIRGIDQATPVIENIAAQLARLHELAVIPITLQYGGVGAGGGGAMNIPLPTPPVLTPEAVQNSSSTSIGDVHINIPDNAAPQTATDWRDITRNYIVPELRKLNS